MEPEAKTFNRQPAIKITIKELESSEYFEEQNQNPNYLITNEGKKVYRINLLATIVHKEFLGSMSNLLIDDGTGKIILRFFEENKSVLNLEVGDVILVIGKARRYNQEKYVFPEIVKKTNPLWLKLRSQELQVKAKIIQEKAALILDKSELKKGEEKDEDNVEEIEENDPLLPYQKISQLISELDRGEGVLIEEIIEKSPLEKTEELLEKMLENGDIFQNLPGKVRVL
ncbi:hypothetical protein HYV87_00365 [Candidatus Woesearchaeota archaeon]|nr:hypothetical protein [Candidatus Woesearchaeota archaeon]MBI2581566.1 hypothetical protein [Candidatus Woesearchaeota archaeon]